MLVRKKRYYKFLGVIYSNLYLPIIQTINNSKLKVWPQVLRIYSNLLYTYANQRHYCFLGLDSKSLNLDTLQRLCHFLGLCVADTFEHVELN